MASAYQDLTEILFYYQIFLLACGLLSTLLYALHVFLVAFKSPQEMSQCRWLILTSGTTCYALTLLFALWQPVPLFPLMGTYQLGPLIDPVGKSRLFTTLQVTLIMSLSIGYITSFVYQYAALRPFSRMGRWIGCGRRTWAVLGVGTLLAAVIAAVFSWSATTSDEQLRDYVLSQMAQVPVIVPVRPGIAPSLLLPIPTSNGSSLIYDIYINQPTLIGTHSSIPATACLSAMAVLFTLEGVLIVKLNFGNAAEIAATENVVLPSTRQLQLSLQRLFLIQSLLFVVCFILPFFVIFLCIMEVIPQTRLPLFSLPVYVLINVHTPLLLLRLISYKPYRQAMLKMVGMNRGSSREGDSSAGTTTKRKIVPLTSKNFSIAFISDLRVSRGEKKGGVMTQNDFVTPSAN